VEYFVKFSIRNSLLVLLRNVIVSKIKFETQKTKIKNKTKS